jgi:hypothetical protein
MDMNLLSFHLPDGQQGKRYCLDPFTQLVLIIYRASGNVAKHLSRAAAEYAQILYHGAKARSEKCAYIDEVQWVCELCIVLYSLCLLTFPTNSALTVFNLHWLLTLIINLLPH